VKPANLPRDLPIPRDLTCRVLRSGEAEVALLAFTPEGPSRLTAAEKDIALAISRGLSNAEIAAARHSSARTVANQLAGILKKLGVSSRVELVATFDVQAFT
jgi:DNA-binding CsgD family transcriptional regulator